MADCKVLLYEDKRGERKAILREKAELSFGSTTLSAPLTGPPTRKRP